MKTKTEIEIWTYAGLVERPRRVKRRSRVTVEYARQMGYSANNTYPWLTREEARQASAADGKRAVFRRAK